MLKLTFGVVKNSTEVVDTRIDAEIRPVPLNARRGLAYPAMVWSGFSVAFVCVVIGDRLQQALGTVDAILAVLLGNWILFLYSAAIGFACGRWGLNFPLSVQAVFGKKGAILPGLILGTLVSGWFAYQLGLTVDILLVAFGDADRSMRSILVVGVGLLFALPVVLGIRRGLAVTASAFPAMVFFGAYCFWALVVPAGWHVFDGPLLGNVPFSFGVAIAFGTFVVSGTMTGDIVRYSRTGSQAVETTAIAFLLSNLPFMLLGVLVAAAGYRVMDLFRPETTGKFAYLLLAIALLSNWASCDACMANATLSIKGFVARVSWSLAASVAALGAIATAFFGLIDDLFGWMTTLAILVPPAGGIMIADYYVLRGHHGFAVARRKPVNYAAAAALVIGVASAGATSLYRADLFFPFVGVLFGGLSYLILAGLLPRALGLELAGDATGAEAVE